MAEPTSYTEGLEPAVDRVSVATASHEPAHTPYVADGERQPELTWPALVAGALLGIVFGASSLYLVLKVGLTVSASIPVAVLSITLFRLFSRLPFVRRATILENNIVQTTGSAGESIAFGVGVTMPALFLLGFEMDVVRVMTVAVLGGLLGILMMIPLRRAFIVKQHGRLKYPEGTACADVLIVGEQGGASAKAVFTGFGIAFVYALLMKAMKLWKDTLSVPLYNAAGQGLKKGVLGGELDPALLGVGYIIGPRIASIMVAGGVLAYLVLVPAIAYFGEGLTKPLAPAPENGLLIKDMPVGGPKGIRTNYILYIGAGAVAAGGIISMLQALPVIFGAVAGGLRDLRGGQGGGPTAVPRTERDLPLAVVVFGSLALVLAIALAPSLGLGLVQEDGKVHILGLAAAGLIVLLGFLFVTVSSRLTGEVGSSSNPISGMTVAALLITCLVFVLLGRTDKAATLTALTVAAVVCIASSNGGTTSQDLKTGFLVGATPSKQQIAILVGALTSAFVIGYTLLLLNNAGTVYSKKADLVPDYRVPADVLAGLPRQAAGGQYGDDPKPYAIFHVGEAEATAKLPAGKYLADVDTGKLVYYVDPAINGKLTKTDDGRSVKDNKYTAPKTQLMEKIISGIFNQKLPWGLVLLGVLIAFTLELSGVPSLPFAVGVYLPLESSTPIFLGGAVRWFVDWLQRRRGRVASETESEMSPGSLLSTGYIAGASIAGVLYAFVAASPSVSESLARWEFRTVVVEKAAPVKEAYRQEAMRELGLAAGEKVPAGREAAVDELAGEFAEINESQILKYIPLAPRTPLLVPQGSTVYEDGARRRLEKDKTIDSAAEPETLGEYAQRVLGNADRAAAVFENNNKKLKLPAELPAGAVLKAPQGDLTALLVSGGLVLFLALVGAGLFLRTPTATRPPPGPAANGQPVA
jgi:putative OPT family oligopeptide transporter